MKKDKKLLESDPKKKNAPFSSDKQIVLVDLNNTKATLGKVTQDVFIHHILARLPWKDIVSSHFVSKTWYDACKILRFPYVSVELCWKKAKKFTWRSLWTYLLGSEKIMMDDLTFVYVYFRHIGLPTEQNIIELLDKAYQSVCLLNYNYRKLSDIVDQYSERCWKNERPEIKQEIKQNALKHAKKLQSKWCREQPTNMLLATLKQLIETAKILRKNSPQIVQWLLTSESQYELPQHFNSIIKPAYEKLHVFLNKTAEFEQNLLEFMVFYTLIENSQPYVMACEQNLLISKNNFPLQKRLSKHFFQHYLGYLDCVSLATKNHELVLLNPDLFDYLCDSDDEFLLALLKPMWSELSKILSKNPKIYDRMNADLWMQLGQKDFMHIEFILKNPKIYNTFSSENLSQFIINNRHTAFEFKKILLKLPNKISSFSQSEEKNVEIVRGILSRLTLKHLINLREGKISLSIRNSDLINRLIEKAILEKLKTALSLNSVLCKLKSQSFLYLFIKYPEAISEVFTVNKKLRDDIPTKYWLTFINSINCDDLDCHPMDFILTDSKIYEAFKADQLTVLIFKFRVFHQKSERRAFYNFDNNKQLHAIRQALKKKLKTFFNSKKYTSNSFDGPNLIRFMARLSNFYPLNGDQLESVKQTLKKKLRFLTKELLRDLHSNYFTDDEEVEDSLKKYQPWIFSMVDDEYNRRFRPLVFYSSRIKEKWSAIPFGWQVGFCAFLALTGAAMVSADVVGTVLCPPLLVVLPILGKVALPLLVGAAAGILAGIAGILHLIHIAITPAPRPVPSNCPSTKSEGHIKTQAGQSTRAVNKKNKTVERIEFR